MRKQQKLFTSICNIILNLNECYQSYIYHVNVIPPFSKSMIFQPVTWVWPWYLFVIAIVLLIVKPCCRLFRCSHLYIYIYRYIYLYTCILHIIYQCLSHPCHVYVSLKLYIWTEVEGWGRDWVLPMSYHICVFNLLTNPSRDEMRVGI